MASKGARSKSEILETALLLFVRKGFHGVSISDISHACSLTKGALYHHFESKEQLYRESVAWYFRRRMEKREQGWYEHPEWTLSETVRAGFHHLHKVKAFIRSIAGEGDDAILRFYAFLYEATRLFPEFQKQMDEADACKQCEIGTRFAEAQARGEIRMDLDPVLTGFELDMLLQQLGYMSFVNPDLRDNTKKLNDLCESYILRLHDSTQR